MSEASSLEFEAFSSRLGLPASAIIWRDKWGASQAAFPQSLPPFMTVAGVGETCNQLGIADDLKSALKNELARYAKDARLQRLLWHCHYVLFQSEEPAWPTIAQWPKAAALPDDWGPLFYALLLLTGVPSLLARHRARGIPEAITLDTLNDIELWMREYHHHHGRWGFDTLGWLSLHFRSALFALGRLQFEMSEFVFDFHICRNRQNGEALALAGDRMRFRRDGQFDGANEINDEAAWNATFELDNEYINGYRITRDGAARRELLKLPRREWEVVMKQSTPILSVHIPANGAMDYAQCSASFRQALEFFPRYFPDFRFRGFACHSWLLDPQLAAYLPANSNIVRFLREFHLLPLPEASDAQIFERVFGNRPAGLANAPRDTSLRRAVLDHVERGGHWRGAGGFILTEDLDWNKQDS